MPKWCDVYILIMIIMIFVTGSTVTCDIYVWEPPYYYCHACQDILKAKSWSMYKSLCSIFMHDHEQESIK